MSITFLSHPIHLPDFSSLIGNIWENRKAKMKTRKCFIRIF